MNCWKKKKKKKERALLCRDIGAVMLEDVIKCCDGKSNPIKFFSADIILKATDNFSNSSYIYEIQSYYYECFSGKIDNHGMVIIKKHKYFRYGDSPTKTILNSLFCRDVAISSMISGQKNFVKLLGCCLELEDPVIVYSVQSIQYSSLDFKTIVSWKQRMKIAEDIATGLAYLHTAFSTPFVYRFMSIQNILIDEDGIAKLNNFSWCVSIPLGETFVTVDDVVGSYIYIDDSYMKNGIVSKQTDAYGFGVFMLMLLIGGRERFGQLAESHDNDRRGIAINPRRASKFIEEGRFVDEIADPRMLEYMGEDIEEELCGMNAFLLLSMRCICPEGEVPTMVEVTKELKKIQRSSQNASSSSSSHKVSEFIFPSRSCKLSV